MNEDYEEMMLQITDVLKANNRYRLGDFEQAVKLIREIVTPKGKWEFTTHYARRYRVCPVCHMERLDDKSTGWNYCPNCGARMER